MKKHKFTLLLLFGFSQFFAQQKGLSPTLKSVSENAGDTYALVVGISDYQDESIPDLRFADKDAEAFAAFLKSETGGQLDSDHLKVLINENANGLTNLRKAIINGYDNYEWMQKDTDLQFLREHKVEWKNLMKEYFPDY